MKIAKCTKCGYDWQVSKFAKTEHFKCPVCRHERSYTYVNAISYDKPKTKIKALKAN